MSEENKHKKFIKLFIETVSTQLGDTYNGSEGIEKYRDILLNKNSEQKHNISSLNNISWYKDFEKDTENLTNSYSLLKQIIEKELRGIDKLINYLKNNEIK